MSSFVSIKYEPNVGSQGTPDWTHDLIGAAKELRFHDTGLVPLTTAAGSWPNITQPSAAIGIDYSYAFTTDTTGYGVLGNGGPPEAFTNAHYLQYRWHWDNTGSFASAPVMTCYEGTAHVKVVRGNASIPGGETHDTGTPARSYLKAAAWGAVGAASGAPGTSPSATSGSTGAVTPGAGAWSAWQGLMGDEDWIAANFTPAATVDNFWNVMLHPYAGPYLVPGELVPVLSFKFTYA
jgi:hypothetical protein